MTLSRREGVDIRPTLLRVLTDLYVQTSVHNRDEERQFVELTSRLIDQVDDATRAAVRARLSIYPNTPTVITKKLALHSQAPTPADTSVRPAAPTTGIYKPRIEAAPRGAPALPMQPKDANEISDMFFGADASNRALILHNLAGTPLRPSAAVPVTRAERSAKTLETTAFAADIDGFTHELGEALILPPRMAARVVGDPGGEPLACACKALAISSDLFQRILIFLPAFGSSVTTVYRLARLYDRLEERAALIMLAAWRGSTMMMPAAAKHRPALYDDERQRARPASTQRPAVQPGNASAVPRNTTRGFGS